MDQDELRRQPQRQMPLDDCLIVKHACPNAESCDEAKGAVRFESRHRGIIT